jgi:prevent-host-death family protein
MGAKKPKADRSKPARVRETVSLYEAKTHLSGLVERAAAGEEIVISKSGKPKARLVPLDDRRPLREPGKGRGQWKVRDDFDAPLPEDLVRDFAGDTE